MNVKEYTKKFYRLDIRSRHVDDDVEKIAKYINGLGSGIQDGISFVKLESVEEAYQYALKAEEILTKKHEQRQRGRGGRFQRGRGRSYGEGGISDNFVKDKDKSEWKNDEKGKTEWKSGNSYRGGTSSYRGRGNSYSIGGFHGNCFRCGKEGHRSFECRSSKSGQGNRNIVIQGDDEGSPTGPEAGENLMVRGTLCNKGSDEEPVLRRSLFNIRCKMARKCCKVIIDNGSSTNLASEELVTNL